MRILLKSTNLFCVIILISAFFTGCVTQKDVEYLQRNDRTPKSFKEAEMADYHLKPNDELYVKINSLDDPIANVFSTASGQQNSSPDNITPYGASLMSYTINKEGYLLLPVVGNIYVKDKTVTEVSTILTDSLSHILSQPIVKVKLVNRYISILGEVRNPGHFPYSQEKLTIYDALGLAGDMTLYSDRKDVTLARNENGKNTIVRLDLTKPELLESNYYFLRPNDMVYVKPMNKRIWGMSQFPFALILSTISTALLIYTVVK